MKLKIVAVLVAIVILSAVLVVIFQEQNQIPPKPTTPYSIYVRYPTYGLPNFYMDVDGTRYYNTSATFYWSVGTTHTVSVPNEIVNQVKNPILPPAIQPDSWRLSRPTTNPIQITVMNGTSGPDAPNALEIDYDAIYNNTG